MDDAQTLDPGPLHDHIGEVHGVLDIAVFQIVLQLVGGHDGAVVLALRGGRPQVGQGRHVGSGQQPVVGEVGGVAGHLAGLQGGDEVAVVHQPAPCQVDDPHPVLHLGDGGGVDGVPGGLHVGQVEGHIVGVGVQRVQLLHHLDVAVQPQGGVYGQIGVVAVDLHPQGQGDVGHQGPDGPQAHHPQGLPVQLRADEGGLALLHHVGHLNAGGGLGLHPLRAPQHVPGGQQQGADYQLLHGVGVGPGGVEHHNARLGALVHGDVVHPGPGPGDGPQLLREGVVVELGGAHQDGVLVLHRVSHGVGTGGQAVQAHRGDLVHGFDVIHGFHLK